MTVNTKVKMLDRIASNSEERGTVHYELSKAADDLHQLKAMVSAYRTTISATLTGVRVQTMPTLTKRVITKKVAKKKATKKKKK